MSQFHHRSVYDMLRQAADDLGLPSWCADVAERLLPVDPADEALDEILEAAGIPREDPSRQLLATAADGRRIYTGGDAAATTGTWSSGDPLARPILTGVRGAIRGRTSTAMFIDDPIKPDPEPDLVRWNVSAFVRGPTSDGDAGTHHQEP